MKGRGRIDVRIYRLCLFFRGNSRKVPKENSYFGLSWLTIRVDNFVFVGSYY